MSKQQFHVTVVSRKECYRIHHHFFYLAPLFFVLPSWFHCSYYIYAATEADACTPGTCVQNQAIAGLLLQSCCTSFHYYFLAVGLLVLVLFKPLLQLMFFKPLLQPMLYLHSI
jgi:hypothetical protein